MTKAKKQKGNPPIFTHTFVGREREIAQIERALTEPEINFILIYGAGGMGKTALARFVIDRLKNTNRFAGGIIWVDCEINNSLTAVLRTIALGLGFDPETRPPKELRETIRQHIELIPTLFVFDSYEVVAANDEVLSFIGHLPRLNKTIIISREHAHLPGRGTTIRLDNLSERDAREMLRQLLPEQGEDIDQEVFRNVLQLTGGLPLAVSLVADVIGRGQSLTEVEPLLRYGALSEDKVVERIMQRAKSTMSEQERHAFNALSIFDHPVEAEAVVAVSGIREWSDLAKRLAQKSFIEIIGTRYTLHPLVRSFFRNQISMEQIETLRRRMVKYFLAYVNDYRSDFQALELDWLSIQYAMEQAYQSKDWQIIIEFVSLLGAFLDQRGHSKEYTLWLKRAIEASRAVADEHSYAAFLHNLAVQHQYQGQIKQAIKEFQQSLQMKVLGSDRKAVATTLSNLGNVYANLGEHSKAIDYYEQALMITREVGDRAGEAVTLNNLAVISRATGQPGRALELYQQTLPLMREVGDRAGEATTLYNLAAIYLATGQPGRALELYQQALPIRREVGDRAGEAITLSNLAAVYRATGQPGRALELYQQTLPLMREVGDRPGEAATLSNLAGVYQATGQPGRALELYQQTLPLIREVGDRAGEATTLNNLAEVYDATGQPGRALELHQQALPMLREVGDRAGEAITCFNIAMRYRDLDEPDQAVSFMREAVRLEKQVQHPDYAQDAELLQAWEAAFQRGEPLPGTDRGSATPGTLPLKELDGIVANTVAVLTEAPEKKEGWRETIRGALDLAQGQGAGWEGNAALFQAVLAALDGEIPSLPDGSPYMVALEAILERDLALWYEHVGEAAFQDQDLQFATRMYAEAVYHLGLQSREIPPSLTGRLTELKDQIRDEMFAIIWAEVQGVLTPAVAQMMRDADVLINREQYDEAITLYTDALDLIPDNKSPEAHRQQAVILSIRGICLRRLGQWEEGLKDFERAVRLYEKLRDYSGEGRALLEIGHLYELMNNYEDSRLNYMDAYRLYQRGNDRHGLATSSEHLGRLEFRVRMLPQALDNLEEARDLWEKLGRRGRAAAIESEIEDVKTMLGYQITKAEGRGKGL